MHTSLRLGSCLFGILLSVCSVFAAAPVLQRSDAIGVTQGQSVDYHVVAIGNGITYSAQGLPNGVSIDSSTGHVSGTPADVGTYHVTVTAANGDGTASTTLGISVVSPDAAPLIYAPLMFDAYNTPQQGGDTFTCTLKATGSPTGYAASGDLPNGWMFNSAGFITGSTTQPGMFMVPVNATNTFGTGSAAITVRVHPACTGMQQTTGTVKAGDTFQVTLQFNRPVTFTGAAPYLEFHTYPDSGTKRLDYVSGNGTTTFVFSYTVTASDAAGDILLYPTIQPANGSAVDGVSDSDGLALGAALPIYGQSTPSASIVASTATPTSSTATTVTQNSPSSATTTNTSSTASMSTTSTVVSQTSGSASTSPVASTSSPAATGTDTTAATSATSGSGSASNSVTQANTSSPATTNTSTGTPTSVAANGSTQVSPAASTTTVATASPSTTPPGPASAVASVAGDTNAPGRLVNLSARGNVSAGDSGHAFIAGFVISGDAPKHVLVRAIGPSLSDFGVQNPLANPALAVFDAAGKQIASSDDWSGSDTASASAAVGAFALASGSKDAALALTLAPGSYSMQVLPNGGSGVALAEIYDADTAATAAPLINISSRGFVSSGEGVLTAGFVVQGNAPKKLLVRGVGPALAAFGVSSVLADPTLKIYQGNSVVAQNDDWGVSENASSAADVAEAAKTVGAFDLASGSHDAATIVTLAPGTYTAEVGGANDSSGAAMVEVYELK